MRIVPASSKPSFRVWKSYLPASHQFLSSHPGSFWRECGVQKERKPQLPSRLTINNLNNLGQETVPPEVGDETVATVQQSKGDASSAMSVATEQESARVSLAGVAEGVDLEAMTRAEATTPVAATIQERGVVAAATHVATIAEAQAAATHQNLVVEGTAMKEAEDVTALQVIAVDRQPAVTEAQASAMVTKEAAINLVLALAHLKNVVVPTTPQTRTALARGARRLKEDHSRRVQEEGLQAVVVVLGSREVKALALRLSDRSMAISSLHPTDRTLSFIIRRARMATTLLN